MNRFPYLDSSKYETSNVTRAVNIKVSCDLVAKLMVYFKYYHSPNINYLHLIDTQFKSEAQDLFNASQRNLQDIICDVFRLCAGKIKKYGQHSNPFTPIQIYRNKCCTRCHNNQFTISINQFNFAAPGYKQYRRDIVGKRFSDHPSIRALNLIDYSRKSYRFVPNTFIKQFENFICRHLSPFFHDQIKTFHARQLPHLLHKLIGVLKLLNLESISTSCCELHMNIVDMIREKHYDEPLLLLGVWKSLLLSDQLIVGAFEKLTDHFPTYSKEKLRWVLIMASYLKFDLRGAWMRGVKLKNFSNCPVTSAMLSGDYDQMKTLLDYGFLPNAKPLARYNVYIRHLNRVNRSDDLFPLGINFLIRELLMFLIIRRNRSSDENNLVPKMDRCFYLLWSFTPHPLITHRQLLEENETIRSELPKAPFYQNVKQDLDNLVLVYAEMALDVGDEVAPRQLQHLCKCRIRHWLTAAGNLPHGVAQLGLCKVLQQYLLVPEESVFS